MNNIVHSIFVISNICTEHIDKNMKFGNIWFMDGLLTEDIHTVLTFLTCFTVFFINIRRIPILMVFVAYRSVVAISTMLM